MYPITSIFRTENGLLPGYAFAPCEDGEFDLQNTLLLLSVNKIYPVKRIRVYTHGSGIMSVTRKGYIAAHDSIYNGESVVSIDNAPLRLIEPSSTIADVAIPQYALFAAIWLSGLQWKDIGFLIGTDRLAEIRATPVTMKEFYQGRRYIVDFTKLTTPQIHSWLYHLLHVLFRVGKLINTRSDHCVTLFLNRVWWRDIVFSLLHHFGVDYTAQMQESAVYRIKFSHSEFHSLLARIMQIPFRKYMSDFEFMDKVLPKHVVTLDRHGDINVIHNTEPPDGIQCTRLQSTMTDYRGPFVSFPEVTDFLEVNGLILKRTQAKKHADTLSDYNS